MATIREYYEKDFSHSARLHVKVPFEGEYVEGSVQYDFAGYFAFVALYITEERGKDLEFLKKLVTSLSYGTTQVTFDGKVTIPAAKGFPGIIQVENKEEIEIKVKFFGDTEWISNKNIQASRRLFLYGEIDMTENELNDLKAKACEHGHELQIRGEQFRLERSKHEKPLAFISHDFRDKEAVAKKIAIGLQRMLCPVWYDEFNLKLGDNLRESIEKGLKECKKCILILSPNFISNNGWTKKEFDSIFTREILEEQKLVLPIWYKVTKREVYDYSPSLLNVKGVDWEQLGEEVVCRQIYNAVID